MSHTNVLIHFKILSQAYTSRKYAIYNTNMNGFMDEVSQVVRAEIDGKARLIGDELFRELEPVIQTMLEMYEENDYHVKDITDAIVSAAEQIG